MIIITCYSNVAAITTRQDDKKLKTSVDDTRRQIGRTKMNRHGASQCSLRTEQMTPGQCCPGTDLQCYGCNPNLIELGIGCEDQKIQKLGSDIVGRDCFCDSSCIVFRDCCDDHAETCPELQTIPPNSTETVSSITTTSKSKPTKDPNTTKEPKKTRPPFVKGESWILKDLLKELKLMIKEKFGNSSKFPQMMDKYDHIRMFMLNAEHNCRYLKFPYVGKANDGTLADYNNMFNKIRNDQSKIDNRLGHLDNTFKKYIKRYYYTAATQNKRMGCDGMLSEEIQRSEDIKGKQFRINRLFRKVSKMISKVIRRKAE